MTYLEEARELLAKGRLEASIELLKEKVRDSELRDRVIYLESRFNSLQHRITSGIIDDEDAILEQNRITNSVLVLIANLADPDRDDALPGASNTGSGGSRFDLKWILIGLLSLVVVLGGIYIFTLGQNDRVTEPPPAESPTPSESQPESNGSAFAERSAPPAREDAPAPERRTDTRTTTPTETTGSTTSSSPPAENPTRAAEPPDDAVRTPADPCASISCLNGGRCLDGKCDCPPGYSGDRCQTRTRLSGEDCLRFNGSNLRILEEGGSYILSDGSRRMITFPNREEATQTIALIKHYNLQGSCFAQRPNPALQYFVTSNFELPKGRLSGEDCMRIRNPQNLKARSYNENSWILADGSSVLFRTKSKAETDRIQAVVKHYNPGYICYVGRPQPSVVYLRN